MIAPLRDEPYRPITSRAVQAVRLYTRGRAGFWPQSLITRGGYPSPRYVLAQELREVRKTVDTRDAVKRLWRLSTGEPLASEPGKRVAGSVKVAGKAKGAA